MAKVNTQLEEPSRQDRGVRKVADAVGDFIEGWGFRAIHGRVWTIAALRGEPVSQSEIAEHLGVSRSLVHLAVSELVQFGLMRAASEHRNAPYEAVLDVWPVITDVLRSREWMRIERARLALDALSQDVDAEGPGRWDAGRIRLLLHLTQFAQVTLRGLLSVRTPATPAAFQRWLNRSRGVLDRVIDRLPGG